MSALIHALDGAVKPAIIVAFVTGLVRTSRAVQLHRAVSASLENGTEDQRREAGLTVVEALTREKTPWYVAALPWRKPNDDES